MVSSAVALRAVVTVTALMLLQAHSAALFPKCDLSQGKWVVDETYPLYLPEKCPFIIQQFDCTGNGRSDLEYQKYRWQPSNCILPRWNGEFFSRIMRGKSIMFVGDSLSLNQWQSLACMIYAANPTSPYQPPITEGLLSTIVFTEKNITLMYLRSAFIVDLELRQDGKRVLKLDSVAGSSSLWLQSDVLIFDTWHWWLHDGRKQPWDYIQDGTTMVADMNRLEAYNKALQTWGKWVDQIKDAKIPQIFFQGVSPDHWNGSDWGVPELKRCAGEQKPLGRQMEEGATDKADNILKNVLSDLKKPVTLLDINLLSQFGVDGHPSIYGNPKHRGIDCTHWCLPGVPDAWNQLLYANVLTNLFTIPLNNVFGGKPTPLP